MKEWVKGDPVIVKRQTEFSEDTNYQVWSVQVRKQEFFIIIGPEEFLSDIYLDLTSSLNDAVALEDLVKISEPDSGFKI